MILDYSFKGSNKNIVEMNFVDVLRNYGFNKPCILSSNNIFSKDEILMFDGFIDNEPHTLLKIKNLFQNKFKETQRSHEKTL